MRSSISKEERLEIKKKTNKNMIYLAIGSMIMLFLGLSSGYYIAKTGPVWVSINVPEEFFISTGIIILSSITFFIALRFAKKGKFQLLPVFMIITLILGLLFVKFQRDGWKYMKSKGMYLSDAVKIDGLINNKDVEYGVDYTVFMNDNELKYVDGVFYDKRDEYNSIPLYPSVGADNVASSWMYMLTGLHLVHLLGGIISLIVVTIKSLLKKYNENDIVGIQVSSIYWHFLDFLWLSLLLLLYFVG
ncbi:MAG: hypothetical protein CMP67_08395 [Flavobacteriales bacterium]|nr:hypothetical protein [Flavobacteriales bacterium]MBO72323.1 hypothetical protein [Flavobacteriales bacterium]|tara:strand:+ start:304 stop:1041 length:738 start_codon:yes stop_codon:yes gene_type:complete